MSTQIPPYFPVFYRLIFPGQNALFRGIKCRITSELLEGSAQIRCHSLSLNEWNSEITKIYISMHFQNLPGQQSNIFHIFNPQCNIFHIILPPNIPYSTSCVSPLCMHWSSTIMLKGLLHIVLFVYILHFGGWFI